MTARPRSRHSVKRLRPNDDDAADGKHQNQPSILTVAS
jgi:hypothetical protein